MKKYILLITLLSLLPHTSFAISNEMKSAVSNSKTTTQIEQEKCTQVSNAFSKAYGTYEKVLIQIDTNLKKSNDVTFVNKVIDVYTQAVNKLTVAAPLFVKKTCSSEQEVIDLADLFKHYLAEAKAYKNKTFVLTSTDSKSQFITSYKQSLKTGTGPNLSDFAISDETYQNLTNAGVVSVVAALLTHENFVYCANFTPDIYTNYGFQYANGNSNTKAADEMQDFLWNKIPLWYTDATIRKNANSVFYCVKMLKGIEDGSKVKITQQLVQSILKEYYDIDFKTWNQPYYNNTTSEDMYAILRDIRKWVGDHQGVANYDIFFNDKRLY